MLPHQLGEVSSHSLSPNRLPGFHHRHNICDLVAPSSEGSQDTTIVSLHSTGVNGVSTGLGEPDRQDVGHHFSGPPGPVVLQTTAADKIEAIRMENSYEKNLALSSGAREELQSWVSCLQVWNGKAILQTEPDIFLQTDACLQGCGACTAQLETGGLWDRGESCLHINHLELLAAMLGLQSLVHRKDVHVRLQMDSSAAISYLHHKRGTRSPELSQLAVQIWMLCLSRGIHLSIEFIPGSLNTRADALSRTFNDHTEWQLSPLVFQHITHHM